MAQQFSSKNLWENNFMVFQILQDGVALGMQGLFKYILEFPC